jgi:hypothetical protein
MRTLPKQAPSEVPKSHRSIVLFAKGQKQGFEGRQGYCGLRARLGFNSNAFR